MARTNNGAELLIGDRVGGLVGTDAEGIHGVVKAFLPAPGMVVVECDTDKYVLTAVCHGRDLALDRENR